jgi:hypothetical protein
MKFLHLGLIVAIAFAALLGSALWVVAQSSARAQDVLAAGDVVEAEGTVETSDIQAVGLLITPTVGTNSSQCATSDTVRVRANTTVYYCFKVRNTGVAGDESLTVHNVRTSRGLNRDLSITLAPNTSQDVIFAGSSFTDATNVDVTTFITWTAETPSNQQFAATGRAHIDVVEPKVEVVKSVGQDRSTCPTSSSLRIPSGQSVAFCVSIRNTGDVTLTSHSLTDNPLSISASFNYTLAPGARLDIIPTNMAGLGINGSLERTNITSPFANTVSYTGRANNDLTASGVSTATVDIGNTTVRFTKTLSTQPEDCTGSTTMQVPKGTQLYYCASIQNTGVVTLTHHHLTETYLSIDVSFDYPLAPGQTLHVTNDFLERNNQPIVFGPFEIDPKYGSNNVVGNTMTYSGSSPDGFSVSASSGTSITYPPTPTNTPTDKPDPTSTPIPSPTSTPTDTPVPVTPTPSLTPTFTPETPTATPTHSYAISALATPTPRGQVAGVPQDSQQFTPTPDFNQSISPLPNQQSPDQPWPVIDPVLATATQIAVDATTTAVMAEATAAQIAVENAQATALAETQAILPESPLPTPTETVPVETATTVPTESLPVQSPVPGAELTVLPPLVTAEIATETPAVVVLVVTNTPEAGEALPAGQRPIVYPTPTPTADFVMAAARTFDVAVTTLGWLWFLVGSLIFFVTAGIVAGLFFRQSEAHRFELPEPDYWLEEEPPVDRPRRSSAAGTASELDDEWPADLP